MIWLGCLAAFFLGCLPLWAIFGWRKTAVADSQKEISMTILVPFRNEAKRIGPLLASLEKIDYTRFTILFIDDHSTDAGPDLVKKWVQGNENSRIIAAPLDSTGKKSCLALGVQHAMGEVILTTDADCEVPSGWLRSMNNYFANSQTGFVAGLVSPLRQAGFLRKIGAFDMAALTGVSVGSMGHGVPTMCNGANLAFRKEVFEEVNGYEGNIHIPSGDDEFLMHKIHERFPHAVRYNTDRDAVVQTDILNRLSDMIQQRVRWASKWRYHQDRKRKWWAPMLALAYFVFLLGWISCFFRPSGLIWLGGFTLFKLVADYGLIRKVMRRWQNRPGLLYFLLAQLLYPFYVLSFSILSARRQYVWKDRRYEEAIT